MATTTVEEEPQDLETGDVRLAAALLAMGVPVRGERAGLSVLRPGQRQPARIWCFGGQTECGKYQVRNLITAWREGLPWIARNPDHPWAYVMAGMMNHRNLIISIKDEELFAVVKKGKQFGLLPVNASARTEELVLGRMRGGR